MARRMMLECDVCHCSVNMIGKKGWLDNRYRDIYGAESTVLCAIHDTKMNNETTCFLDEQMKVATGLSTGQAVKLLIDDIKEFKQTGYYLRRMVGKKYSELLAIQTINKTLHIVRL